MKWIKHDVVRDGDAQDAHLMIAYTRESISPFDRDAITTCPTHTSRPDFGDIRSPASRTYRYCSPTCGYLCSSLQFSSAPKRMSSSLASSATAQTTGASSRRLKPSTRTWRLITPATPWRSTWKVRRRCGSAPLASARHCLHWAEGTREINARTRL